MVFAGERSLHLVEYVAGTRVSRTFVLQSPFALSYAEDLNAGHHAVLFYDNLVVAGEYLRSYIEEAIVRHQPTCFVGFSHKYYETLFEQVGLDARELERYGYLKHWPIEDFSMKLGLLSNDELLQNVEAFLATMHQCKSKEARFIIFSSSLQERRSPEHFIEFEASLARLRQYPLSVRCCYDSQPLLRESSHRYLLKS